MTKLELKYRKRMIRKINEALESTQELLATMADKENEIEWTFTEKLLAEINEQLTLAKDLTENAKKELTTASDQE